MNTKPQCPEGRQHISLSQYAYSVVRNDSLTFMGSINYSGFINKIVLNSMIDSFDELAHIEDERIINELTKYIKPGRTIRITETERDVISKIAIAHRNYQIASFASYPKDVPLKIRLNKDLHDILYPLHSEWQGIQYDLSQGDYIKSLVEDYSRKTFFDRESIFFKDTIEELENIISLKDSERKRVLVTLSSDKQYILKPYRMSYDYEADYHYVVGIATEAGNNDYVPASFRLSRIVKLSPRSASSGSGRITTKEEREIERKIKDSGISFILGEPMEHVVKLTPTGMSMYNSMFHQRPIYDHIEKCEDGSFILTFISTKRQITNYFFNFAKEAEFISPTETRDLIKERYKSAYNSYNG